MDIGGPKMFKESKPPKRKKKKGLFNRIADSLSFNELCKGVGKMGDEFHKNLEKDIERSKKIDEDLGLPPEANNAKRFL